MEGTGSYGATMASPTRSTPKRPPRPCKPATQRWCPGGDGQANAALHRIVVVRLCHDQQTKDYMVRRLTEAKTKEIIRCFSAMWPERCSQCSAR